MIRYKSTRQIPLEGFHLPFGGHLSPENRWVKWSRAICWDKLAVGYYQAMDANRGRPCKDARLIIGSVIIKHKLNLSDEETVLQIQENPYLQYFVGFSGYTDKPPFAPSLFVEIRKRMGAQVFSSFEQIILDQIGLGAGTREGGIKDQAGEPGNCGKLVVDATDAEQSIRYPTDLGLLDEARRISEDLIDELYRLSTRDRKPRTYRVKARRQYWIIQHVYSQQDGMYRSRSRRCDDRIVSISQPHVRPIVRGKQSKPVEFGSKLSVSMVEGIALVDHISWDAFNESRDLQEQIESYKRRTGVYPDTVLADGIYGTRENRQRTPAFTDLVVRLL